MEFQCLAGPRNVSVVFCACECFCMTYLVELGEVTASILYWLEPNVVTYIDVYRTL